MPFEHLPGCARRRRTLSPGRPCSHSCSTTGKRLVGSPRTCRMGRSTRRSRSEKYSKHESRGRWAATTTPVIRTTDSRDRFAARSRARRVGTGSTSLAGLPSLRCTRMKSRGSEPQLSDTHKKCLADGFKRDPSLDDVRGIVQILAGYQDPSLDRALVALVERESGVPEPNDYGFRGPHGGAAQSRRDRMPITCSERSASTTRLILGVERGVGRRQGDATSTLDSRVEIRGTSMPLTGNL